MVYRVHVGPTAVREAARLLWGQPGTEHVYFEADDLNDAQKRLRDAGLHVADRNVQEWPNMPAIRP